MRPQSLENNDAEFISDGIRKFNETATSLSSQIEIDNDSLTILSGSSFETTMDCSQSNMRKSIKIFTKKDIDYLTEFGKKSFTDNVLTPKLIKDAINNDNEFSDFVQAKV